MEKEKKNTGKYVLIGLTVIAAGATAVYFLTKPKKGGIADAIINTTNQLPPASTSSSSGNNSSVSKGFPLKRGSRGELVKNLQQALIDKYGVSILPKYGADGQFGKETEVALAAKGISTVVTAEQFTKIVTKSPSGAFSAGAGTVKPSSVKLNPSLVATNLRVAILDSDFGMAIKWLSKISTVKDYQSVSAYFKQKPIGLVKKTIVNGLLMKFRQPSQKKKLNAQFYKMGLKYNGSQWSLSGLGEIFCDKIKTIHPTEVWNLSGKKIRVPEATILGHFQRAKGGVTQFSTIDGKVLLTHTKCICYV